jgi:hypothetical protein
MNKDIGIFQSTDRSGHSTGTSQDSYRDRQCVAGSIPGGRVLAGYAHPYLETFPPNLECLGSHVAATLDAFMGELYPISLSDFLPEGHLRPALRACTASVIMHYPTMLKDVSAQNLVIDKLHRTAQKVKLGDSKYPEAGPIDVLVHWSAVIKENFIHRNVEIARAGVDMPSLVASQNHQSEMLANLQSDVTSMKEMLGMTLTLIQTQQSQMVGMTARIEAQGSQIVSLNTEVGSLKQQLADAKNKLAVLKTPPQTPSQPGVKRPAAAVASPNTNEETSAPVDDEGPASKRPATSKSSEAETAIVATDVQSEAVTSLEEALAFGARANLVVKSKDTNRDFFIAQIIKDIYNNTEQFSKAQKLNFKLIDALDYISERPKFDACMELVEQVATDEQRAQLKKKDLTEQQLTNIADAISSQCMAQMYAYDGKGDPNNTKARAKPTYLGLGGRVANFKREHELTELKKPGTPRGNKSIRSLFSFKGNN